MALVALLLGWAVWAYLVILTVRLVLGWLPVLIRGWEPRGWLSVVAEFVYTVTDPPLRALGRVLKPLRVGDLQIDLAFLVLYFGLLVVQRLLAG
ncbi:MAG TPA: YggT family protein [Propionicimonas sp.]|nr:YggT family protein [Propionicimonas sp.]HQA78962.1 YggT family protein [Propionicimonas sp.]HQD97416.1 YggT family protein [Propionicimonas sp.]